MRILFLSFLFTFPLGNLSPDQLLAQQQETIEIEGVVRSESDGTTLPGVTILVKGTTSGVASDNDGTFSISASVSDTLVFTYIGYIEQEIVIGDQTFIEVEMSQLVTALDQVTIIGYGEARRITQTGAASSVRMSEIETVPVSNVQNTLAGRLPGFFSQQRSGQPGRSGAEFVIRGVGSLNSAGNSPLIVVDDIQYTPEQFEQLDVNMIESVTILKDASTTAIYGVQGANGVVVVRTRRGHEGRPRINVKAETGVQAPTYVPEFLNSYEAAQLANEGLGNDGLTPWFSEHDLEMFRSGEDPYGYPDVNWYEAIWKDYATQANLVVDISGGTDKLRYFISGGAFTQSGLLRDFSDPQNEVNTNYFYRRFNFRSNLDFNATDDLKFRFDLSTRFNNINQPRAMNAVSEIYDFEKIRPWSAPVMNPNGTYAYAVDTQDNLATINARLANSGYHRDRRTDTNLLFQAEHNLDAITEGLAARARVAYAVIDANNRQLTRYPFGTAHPPSYHYNSADGSYTLDPRGRYTLSRYSSLGETDLYRNKLDLQAFLDYRRTFGLNHTVSSMILYNRESTTELPDVPYNRRGVTTRVGYDYNEKYMIDFTLAYNGSDRFSEGHRIGFFPAVSAGWNLASEPFFQNAFPVFQMFKLRASYGLVGSDETPGSRYLYEQVYSTGNLYSFGETHQNYQTVFEGALGNLNVTWEKKRSLDVGLDIIMFNENLSLSVDYFYEYRYDQLIPRGGLPGMLGIDVAPTNIGITENRGFDGQLAYQNAQGAVLFNTSLTFSYAKNEILYVDDPTPPHPGLSRIGQSLGQPFGYTFDGFYTKEDIALINTGDPGIPVPAGGAQPGDIKYRDLDGDGRITELDRGPVGKPNLPTTTAGWSVGAGYKGFSVNVLFQGSFDYSFYVLGTGIEPFKSQFQPIHQDRWTPDNAQNARFPRLTSDPNSINSPTAYLSDFWLLDAWYVRLKSLDIGYQIPPRILPFNVNSVRLYVSGFNLFTWSNDDMYRLDPEVATGIEADAYYNQRVLNLGIQVGF